MIKNKIISINKQNILLANSSSELDMELQLLLKKSPLSRTFTDRKKINVFFSTLLNISPEKRSKKEKQLIQIELKRNLEMEIKQINAAFKKNFYKTIFQETINKPINNELTPEQSTFFNHIDRIFSRNKAKPTETESTWYYNVLISKLNSNTHKLNNNQNRVITSHLLLTVMSKKSRNTDAKKALENLKANQQKLKWDIAIKPTSRNHCLAPSLVKSTDVNTPKKLIPALSGEIQFGPIVSDKSVQIAIFEKNNTESILTTGKVSWDERYFRIEL